MSPPSTSDRAIERYLHVRWAIGDDRCQTRQLWRFREHGGHCSPARWSRRWALARHFARRARERAS